MNKEKAIIIASYGTSYIEQLSVIENIKNKIENRFKDFDILLCFTSKRIIKKLKKRNIFVNSLESTLNSIKYRYKHVIVQPLHLIDGSEYKNVIKICIEFRKYFKTFKVGEPALYNENDYLILKKVFHSYINDKALLLIGHGSNKSSNYYAKIQSYFIKIKLPIFVDTIENSNIKKTIGLINDKNISEIILAPLSLVFGYHSKYDIFSDNSSIKNTLVKFNFIVTEYKYGLGENDKFLQIYVNKIEKLL